MTDLQMLGNSFCEFGLVSTYQRFSATFRPKIVPFWIQSSKDSGHAALDLSCHNNFFFQLIILFLHFKNEKTYKWKQNAWLKYKVTTKNK